LKRHFYVVYIEEREISECLDSIRFLLNPMEKQRAHVTLRGPTLRHLGDHQLRNYNDILKGSLVSVNGAGSFFSPTQHTVFLKCDSYAFQKVWRKPDFGYNPHLTLYDGDDRDVARKFLHFLDKQDIYFEFHCSQMEIITSHKGQYDLSPHWSMGNRELQGLLGENANLEQVKKFSIETRFQLVETIVQRLLATVTTFGKVAMTAT